MEYNSSRNQIEMREYGRYIQKLVDFAMTKTDRKERLRVCENIIDIMGTLNPTLKINPDFGQLMWDHLFVVSNFKLDVDWPYEKPTPELARIKPTHLPYPRTEIKFKHYGKNVHSMVKKASEMEDSDKKLAYTELIGNFMKLAYKTWSNEEVSLELVKGDMISISAGQLAINEEMNIDSYSKLTGPTKPAGQQNKNNNNRNWKNNNYKKNQNNRKKY
ncbi:MAG: DUF4290 domain-containing protein [Bacteroidetes bacterium]|nr:DUF4290 domain-containing protein [Bacteroidota bacterium]MBP7256147.1 DUF4290 domain-containing protein [Chitinophagales bacterium]MBK7505528.1 DUF4290 domain-containing protein [Bacteroidota bacterium]MBK7641384.1 DUF4290 domain-containing protein [Bacteroidota bacterium]MBK8673473.1 DUF4290 domain-containing protein [Bacteroidota bacterium]